MNKLSFTIQEACKTTGISRSKLYEAFAAGLLVPRKFDGRTLILRSDLERFLHGLPTIIVAGAHQAAKQERGNS